MKADYLTEKDLEASLTRAYETETDYTGMFCENGSFSGVFEACNMDKCLFSSCRFDSAQFKGAGFTDCVFRSCDLSNSDMSDAYFNRCRFENCKLLGAKFVSAVIYSTDFLSCNLSYSSFFKAKTDTVSFKDCRLGDATFSEMKLVKKIGFSECSFVGCSFFKTPLKGIDLTENDLSGIVVSESLYELKGAFISSEQALIVAKMMGIKVIDK